LKVTLLLQKRGEPGVRAIAEFILSAVPRIGEDVLLDDVIYQIKDVIWDIRANKVALTVMR